MLVVYRDGLPWPPGKSRCRSRRAGLFKSEGRPLTTAAASVRALEEIGRFSKPGGPCRVSQVALCCQWPVYVNGSGFKPVSKCEDPGVVVSFDLDGKGYTVACDTYLTPADNFAAIAAYISGLRAQERHGVAGLDEMLAGHAALPSAGSKPFWWTILGVDPGATVDQVNDAYKRLIYDNHPDRGGDPERASEINAARDEALKELADAA